MPRAKQSSVKGSSDFVRALRRLGVTASESPAGLEVSVGDGAVVLVRPVTRSVLSAGRAQDVARAVADEGPGVPVVIAEKIPAAARDVLTSAGVGWFDRRGHLRVHAAGLLIDADVPAASAKVPRVIFPSGRTGVGTALALLVAASLPGGDDWSSVSPTVSEIADLAKVAVSGASTALKTFRSLGYLNGDGSPVVPDLFWATVEHWAPQWVGLAQPVDGDPGLVARLDANLDDLDELGWCVAGDAAAAAWHAPTVGGDVGARQWYVPVARRARHVALDPRRDQHRRARGRLRGGGSDAGGVPLARRSGHRCPRRTSGCGRARPRPRPGSRARDARVVGARLRTSGLVT